MKSITRVVALRWVLATCFAGLAACVFTPPVDPQKADVARPLPALDTALLGSFKPFQIDSNASTLHILVYRGGPMAHLGHNHVISSRSMTGKIWHAATAANSGFEIQVPVNALIVDDNAARAAEGADFPLNISEDTKSGTRANMLRETLLDGTNYPVISIRSVSAQGPADTPVVVAAMQIKGQTRQITVPVTVRTSGLRILVNGEFSIRQTDFGITPLSVALGALQVVDTIKIKFELVAKTD